MRLWHFTELCVDCTNNIKISEISKQPNQCFTRRLYLSPYISSPLHHITRNKSLCEVKYSHQFSRQNKKLALYISTNTLSIILTFIQYMSYCIQIICIWADFLIRRRRGGGVVKLRQHGWQVRNHCSRLLQLTFCSCFCVNTNIYF